MLKKLVLMNLGTDSRNLMLLVPYCLPVLSFDTHWAWGTQSQSLSFLMVLYWSSASQFLLLYLSSVLNVHLACAILWASASHLDLAVQLLQAL